MSEEERARLFKALERDILESWFGGTDLEEILDGLPLKTDRAKEPEHIGRRTHYGSHFNQLLGTSGL